jgi:hypothetical protein
MDCICIAKKTIGILWKAFEGILNDRAENQQYSIQAFKISLLAEEYVLYTIKRLLLINPFELYVQFVKITVPFSKP